MKDIIKESDIDKLSVEEQLEFYKKEFCNQHCDDCGNELNWGWIQYDGTFYCESCFDYRVQEERQKAILEILDYKNKIIELKEKYNIE